MKLHSIRLRNYRGIVDSTVEFASGVTVVEGPNEVGKSSIAEAIRHLREDKSSSRKQGIKDIQPVGADVGPEVELHLSTGDYEVRYEKGWLKQPYTRLNVIAPNPEQLTSDDAHERFLAILAETVDVDLLIALDVAQGGSLEQAPLAQIKALHSALNESGVEVVDHDEFLVRIEEEYSKFFTKSGKPTGDYKDAIAEVPAAEEAFVELRERSRGMDDMVENHARAQERLDFTRGNAAKAIEELARAEESAAAVADLKRVLDQAQSRAETAQREVQIAQDSLERRDKLLAELASGEELASITAATVNKLEAARSDIDADFETAQAEVDKAQARLDASREQDKRAARALTKARAAVERTRLSERLESIRTYDRQRAQAQATISSIKVTPTDIDRLVALETDVRIAENAKTSAAAQVTVKRLGENPVLIDDTELGAGDQDKFAVIKDLRILIDGIADITMRPGVSPADLDAAVDSARKVLDAALSSLEVESIDQARERAQIRVNAESELAEAMKTVSVLLGRDKREDLEANLAKAERIAGENADDIDDTTADDSTVDIAQLERELEVASADTEAAQAAVDEARTTIESKREVRDRSRVELAQAQTSAKEASLQVERLKTAVAEARERDSDEALQAAVAQSTSRNAEFEEELKAAHEAYMAKDPESLEMILSNARQSVKTNEENLAQYRQEVDGLTALLDDRASEGIYDKLAAAELALETARSKRDRLDRQAKAISLLRSTVLARKEEAQRKYVAPFSQEIERLGRLIFGPELSIEVAEDLSIVSRTLGGRTVPFESLSGGTKEQLALIGRLAVANLVAGEAGAPVVLDDAFGFADSKRLNALNVILNTVGQNAQVILLTCQPERFAGIGGATTVSLGA